MKKHILYNFSFYIHKNINIQKIYEIKKILTFKLIFQYQEIRENYISILKRGWVRGEYIHPHTQLKKLGIPIPIPSQCGNSSSK